MLLRMAKRRDAQFPNSWKELLKAPWLERLVYEEARPEDPPGKAWYAYIREEWLSPKFDRFSNPYQHKDAHYVYGTGTIELLKCLHDVYWDYIENKDGDAARRRKRSFTSTTQSVWL